MIAFSEGGSQTISSLTLIPEFYKMHVKKIIGWASASTHLSHCKYLPRYIAILGDKLLKLIG